MIPAPDPESCSQAHVRARVAKGTRMLLTMETQTMEGQPLERQAYTFEEGESEVILNGMQVRARGRLWASLARKMGTAAGKLPLSDWLLGLAVVVYLLVRMVGLSGFPIYFFTDEAVQTLLASDLVRDDFRSPDDEVLPTYFKNVYQYNLSVSVYIQVLPAMLLPRSVEVTRGTAVIFTLIAALAAGLMLRNVYRSPTPWLGVLILSMTPAWLLHSRTAFETALAVSFYAGFLYCYLMYRKGRVWYLYAAIFLAALAFYSYSPAQVVVGLTAVLLFFSDLRYHWQNRRALAWGLGLVLILCLPYIRFLINHPAEQANHLRQLNSYWVSDISLGEKLGRFAGEYLRGLDPTYWYFPNKLDFTRHRFGNYGHLFWALMPLGVLGLFLALRRIRQPEYRVLLIGVLAAPAGAALAGLGVTRALFMVVPMALLSALAFSEVLAWLGRRWKKISRAVWIAALVLLVAANGLMITDALLNGPLWFQDYGMGGIQYGANQVFAAADRYVQQHPGTKIYLTPVWANGTDILLRYYYPESPPVVLSNVDAFMSERRNLENTILIMIEEEYDQALASGKFKKIDVVQILPYPDGTPGFLFTQLAYVDDIDAILAREEAELRQPEQTTLTIDGQDVQVIYSRLDIGEIKDVFDGKDDTLMRTLMDNPMSVEMVFPQPRSLSGVVVRVEGIPTEITARVFASGAEEAQVFNVVLDEVPDPRSVEVSFEQAYAVERLIVEVRKINEGDKAHVHVWEIRLK